MLRRVVYQQVDVVGSAVHFDQLGSEVRANLAEDSFAADDSIFVKYLFPM
jgi:hypothetical protein